MKTFAGKAPVSADKVRGGYYTPAPIARFLARWVREAVLFCGVVGAGAARMRTVHLCDAHSLASMAAADFGVESAPALLHHKLFMLRQIHLAPRRTVNAAAATSTDTVRRVRLHPGVGSPALAAVFHNSATFAFTEVMGRSYGGGILEVEPVEAGQLPVPPPGCAGPGLAREVDLLLKAGGLDKALDVVERRVLVDGLGWPRDVVSRCRSAWVALRGRRLRRVSR